MGTHMKNHLSPAPGFPPLAEIHKLVGAKLRTAAEDPVLSRIRPKGIPLLYEDEGPEMGESNLHTVTCGILLYGLKFHFVEQPVFRVYSNLNVYYSDEDPSAYFSPDLLVLKPPQPLPEDISSYEIGKDGPVPLLVAEVLSYRTYQEGDLSHKPVLYATLGIEEYILVDVTGDLLAQKLLLLRRQADGSWSDEQDADGGVTSRLGFRLILEADGQVRVVNTQTGKRYSRPQEAQAATDGWTAEIKARRKAQRAAAKAHQQAEERIHALEEELKRLRQGKRKRKKD
jgi:Uma2 family endonuclease